LRLFKYCLNIEREGLTMLSAYKYRLYPNEEQGVRLKRTLRSLCDLYNWLRGEKIRRYKEEGKSLTKTDLRALALQARRGSDELQEVYSQVVQNAADRVHIAFRNFLEGRARFPRAKNYKKYRSLTYPQSGFRLQGEVTKRGKKTELRGRLFISKMGEVRIFLHRPIEGEIERLTVKYEAGEWYACLITGQKRPEKPHIESIPKERIRGADLGLERFITLDNSESEGYPEFLRRSEEKIRMLQRSISRKKRVSKRYNQLAFQLAKLHLHTARQREDWQNKIVSKIFKEADVIVLERLSIQNILKNHNLAKSIADASFGRFAGRCIHKTDALGKHSVFVDAWGTTQFCFRCLHWVPKELSDREHICPNCGVKLPRDLNSARLIKRLGILALRRPPSDGGSSPAELRLLPSLRGMVSPSVEAGSHRF